MTEKIEWGGTPGPWRHVDTGRDRDHVVRNPDGEIATVYAPFYAGVTGGERWEREARCNARTIAQLPAMVVALRRLVDSAASLVDYHDDDETEAAIDGARAILAAIDGESAA